MLVSFAGICVGWLVTVVNMVIVALPLLPKQPFQPTDIPLSRRSWEDKCGILLFSEWVVHKWKWLHCDVTNDKAYCLTCVGAIQACTNL